MSSSRPVRLDATARARLQPAMTAVDRAARLSDASLLGQGWGAVAFRVPSPGGDWVLRLPRAQSHWAIEDLEREVRLLPLLGRQPFSVTIPGEARLLKDDAGATIAAVHRMVPGTPLGQSRHPRGRGRTRLLADMARALSVLHATPKAAARRHGAREIDLWSQHYVPYIDRALPLLPLASRAWLASKARDFERRGGTSSAPRVLIHGDLSGDHFLVDGEGRLTGIIDFADARIADPALDFAGILNELGWRDLERVLEDYTGQVDSGLLRRARFYIDVAPIYQVVDGAVAIGPELQRTGIRRLAARAGAAR
jgi:aminoglycoside phosphotransferase (APT) family kinase protein